MGSAQARARRPGEPPGEGSWEEQVVSAIRRVIQAVDSHSRRLREGYGLTGPQLTVLRQLVRWPSMSAGQLARAAQLGQPTVKVILDRLETRGLIERRRDEKDRRSIRVSLTPAGREASENAPSLLQETFRQQLDALEDWERTQMLGVLQRVASMMTVAVITPSPPLATPSTPEPARASR